MSQWYTCTMKRILFATTNSRKVQEANAACKDFDIEVEQIELDILEIQSRDIKEIAVHKAEEAYKFTDNPVVVTDSSWNIPSLGGFPGGYMKDVAEWFTSEDFMALMKSKNTRELRFSETIVYKDGATIKLFAEEYPGRLAEKPRGNGNSIENVAEFNGRTLSEAHAAGETSHDPKDYIWYQFAKWYKDR